MQTKTYAKIADLKNSAKNFLAGKYQVATMTFLFYFTINLLFGRFSYSLMESISLTARQFFQVSENDIVVLIFNVIVRFVITIMQNIVQIGLCLFFLNLACGRRFNAFDLLYGFSHHFERNFCLAGLITLLNYVCLLPANIFLDCYENNVPLSRETLYLMAGLQVVLFLGYYVLSLALSQIYYIALDHPELSVLEILQHSFKLMKGQKLRLFLLDLSFLPLLLLIIPTFGLGVFWILPYQNMTRSLFFLDLMQVDISTPSAGQENYS